MKKKFVPSSTAHFNNFMQKPTISFILPALNEEQNIGLTVQSIISSLDNCFSDYELILINDGSTDRTGFMMEQLAVKDSHIKVIHHEIPQNLGFCYFEGVRKAGCEYVMMVPGDNEITQEAIKSILSKVGTADIVIPYISNPLIRPFSRRFISRLFTLLMNIIFNLRIKYFNGPCVLKKKAVNELNINASGFSYMAETLILLIKRGYSYVHVPMLIKPRNSGVSKALKPKNFIGVGRTILGLIRKIYLSNDYIFGFLFLIFLTLFFFFPVVIGRQTLFEALPTFFSDRLHQVPGLKTTWTVDGGTMVRVEAPQTLIGARMMRQGVFPLWDPFAAAGQPLAGDLVGSLYHPLKILLFFIFPFLATFDFYILLRLFLAGFGMFIFLKEINLSKYAALFGAVAYMFSGFFITLMTLWFLNVDMALPYVMWGFERYFKNRRLKDVCLTGLLLSLIIFGSQPEYNIVAGVFILIYIFYRLFGFVEARRDLIRHFGNIFLIGVIALIIALPLILDFTIFFKQSDNIHSLVTGGELSSAGGQHFSLQEMLHFIIAPSMFLELAMSGGIYQGRGTAVPYIGMTVIILAILGIILKNLNKLRNFFLLALGFFIFKLAGLPPVQWVSSLPLFNLVYWIRFYGPLFFTVSSLAAIGYDGLRQSEFSWKKFITAVASIPFIFLTVYFYNPVEFIRSYKPVFDFAAHRLELINAVNKFLENFPSFVSDFASAFLNDGRYFMLIVFATAAFFALIIIAGIFYYFKTGSRKVYLGILAVLIFELFLYMPKIRDGLFHRFDPYLDLSNPVVSFLRQQSADGQSRFIAANNVIVPQTSGLYGLEDFRTTDAVYLKRYGAFAGLFLPRHDISNFTFDETDIKAVDDKYFDLANIRYVITEKLIADKPKDFELVLDKELKIYENKTFLPRTYIVHIIKKAADFKESATLIQNASFDYWNSAVVESEKPLLDVSALADKSAVKIINYQPRKITLKTEDKAAGFLILTDSFYYGWQAFIDGKETKIYPANLMFRGIFLPPGFHYVEFNYQPWWFFISGAISLLTIFVVLLIIIKPKIFQFFFNIFFSGIHTK